MSRIGASKDIEYRTITGISELHTAVDLQRVVWGQESVTSMHQMAAAILHGGTVIGAFHEGELVGFCYGFAGFDGKHSFLGSHMMAILPDYRDQGIGMRLKLEQRLWAIQYGYSKLVWTYDPFESRNAYLNICKLGGTISKYLPSFYGNDSSGVPTDRFLVEWDICSEHVEKAITQRHDHSEQAESLYPSLITCDIHEDQVTSVCLNVNDPLSILLSRSGGTIPIPRQAQELKRQQPQLFAEWHRYVRDMCTEAFDLQYEVTSFIKGPGAIHHYVLEQKKGE
ncbi:MAG: hypothetical protein K0R67_1854 [Paenibacillus sp.]|jgi:predicted GNAT superfamily acetyltransferase|nr:hypothetical protein [Paenibacillus sp.]